MYRIPVRYLETILRIPFINKRIGLTTLIGAIPFVGATVAFLLAGYPLLLASQVPDLPNVVTRKMVINCCVGAGLSMVPLIGGLLSNCWKPGLRNLRLLEKWVTQLEVAIPQKIVV
ncbi:hypothetical protein HDU85_006647 [Gaertneriomyces sp. JEL0708]|nr:hypothetical protein HDU85_006647 [Gaertneriomyces sp. JEL0708]